MKHNSTISWIKIDDFMDISSKYSIQIGIPTKYRAQYGTYLSKYSTQNRRYFHKRRKNR